MTFLYLISSQIIQLNGFPRAYVHRQCACLHWFIFTAMMYWHSIHWQINEIKLKACVHRECNKLIFDLFTVWWNPIGWISCRACVHRECVCSHFFRYMAMINWYSIISINEIQLNGFPARRACTESVLGSQRQLAASTSWSLISVRVDPIQCWTLAAL